MKYIKEINQMTPGLRYKFRKLQEGSKEKKTMKLSKIYMLFYKKKEYSVLKN